jgi:hypothetical protein
LATYTPKPLICACGGEVKIERFLKWIGRIREGCVEVHIGFSIEMAKKVILEEKLAIRRRSVDAPESPLVRQNDCQPFTPALAACNIGDGVHQKRHTCLEAA